jgi:hypothetical protein
VAAAQGTVAVLRIHPEVLPMAKLLQIGWKESLEFPEWGLRRVRVKIDTGAWSSALDVLSYELQESPDGQVARVQLDLGAYRPRKGDEPAQPQLIEVQAPVIKMTTVSNACGHREVRPVIEALIKLGRVEKRIRLTLTNRSSMRHRMILGRQALAGSFLVDVGSKYLLRRKKG